jgi:hypothetical protein
MKIPVRPSLSGMGELHLEIIVDRMRREFKVEVNQGAPQVAYKEAFQAGDSNTVRYAEKADQVVVVSSPISSLNLGPADAEWLRPRILDKALPVRQRLCLVDPFPERILCRLSRKVLSRP